MRHVCGILIGAAVALALAPDAFAQSGDLTPGATVFLNRNGGVYFRSFANDAVNNTSSLVPGTRFVPPFAGTDEDWRRIVNRVRARFAPFDVAIVDEEPAPPSRYIEAVVGGRPSHLGFPSGVLGVAPVYCSPAATTIVFIFAELIQADTAEIARTVEHEVGHAFSLDHALICKDPMTYLSGCGEKTFQNTEASCGEGSARPCFCGAPAQNSFATLLNAFGSRDGRLRPLPEHAASETAEPLGICTVPAPLAAGTGDR